MDSLLANYASSDDEEEEPKPSSSLYKPFPISSLPPPKSSKPSLFSSLPSPIIPPPSSSSSSSSLFSSLPPPKSRDPDPQTDQNRPTESKQTRPIFSSLPPPKSQQSLNPNPKKVVQFTLPFNPFLLKPSNFDDEDEKEEEERKPAKDSSSSAASKGLSSMLPAPKNSLCLGPTSSSRRSAFDSGAEGFDRRQESSNFGSSKAESFEGGEQERGSFVVEHGSYPLEQGESGYENDGEHQERSSFQEYDNYTLEQGVSGYENFGSYDCNWAVSGSVDSSYGTSYESGAGSYGGYAGNWSNGGAVAAPVVPEMERIVGKRGRNEIPAEIVEVNQAELIKNRPREDQVKLTGIAFGPAYQFQQARESPQSCTKGNIRLGLCTMT